jgi:hypothetical protein
LSTFLRTTVRAGGSSGARKLHLGLAGGLHDASAKRVIEIAKTFGMKVIALDVRPDGWATRHPGLLGTRGV